MEVEYRNAILNYKDMKTKFENSEVKYLQIQNANNCTANFMSIFKILFKIVNLFTINLSVKSTQK